MKVPAGAERLGCPLCGFRVVLDELAGWWVCAHVRCRWCCEGESWLGTTEHAAPGWEDDDEDRPVP